MGRSKIVYNGEPLLDLTSDTVTPETLYSGVTAHNAAGEPITGTGGVLKFYNVVLARSFFKAGGDDPDYPYRAAVQLTGVTAAMVPAVMMAPGEDNGILRPEAETYDGGVYIYACCRVNKTLTAETIYCFL